MCVCKAISSFASCLFPLFIRKNLLSMLRRCFKIKCKDCALRTFFFLAILDPAVYHINENSSYKMFKF